MRAWFNILIAQIELRKHRLRQDLNRYHTLAPFTRPFWRRRHIGPIIAIFAQLPAVHRLCLTTHKGQFVIIYTTPPLAQTTTVPNCRPLGSIITAVCCTWSHCSSQLTGPHYYSYGGGAGSCCQPPGEEGRVPGAGEEESCRLVTAAAAAASCQAGQPLLPLTQKLIEEVAAAAAAVRRDSCGLRKEAFARLFEKLFSLRGGRREKTRCRGYFLMFN